MISLRRAPPGRLLCTLQGDRCLRWLDLLEVRHLAPEAPGELARGVAPLRVAGAVVWRWIVVRPYGPGVLGVWLLPVRNPNRPQVNP